MKGILFDLDGTLWDSCGQSVPAWNAVMEELGLKVRLTQETIHAMMGKTGSQIAGELFPFLSAREGLDVISACFKKENAYLAAGGGRIFQNVETVLKNLSRTYFLAVVSNCDEGYIEIFLDFHGFRPYISDWECAGKTGLSKGGNIKLVMRRSNLDRALYVGDTQIDMDAAKEAGIPFIFAGYGFGHAPDAAFCITDIEQLPAMAEKLLES